MSFSGRRFIRADFLPSDKFCSKLRFRQFRKEVYEKFSAFFLHAGAHSEPGNLEYRNAGDTVVGKLHFSLFRQNLLIFNQKRNLRAHPNTRPGGKLVSFAAERAEGRGKRNRSELKLIGKSKCISVGTGDLGSTASAADDDAVSRVLPSFGAHQITIFGFFHCNSRFPCLDFYLSESGLQNQQIKNGLCLLAGRIKPAFTAPDADAELFKKLFGVLFGKLFENP